jgi:hypothetical protein
MAFQHILHHLENHIDIALSMLNRIPVMDRSAAIVMEIHARFPTSVV